MKWTAPNTKASCGRNDPAWKPQLNEIPETSIKSVYKKYLSMEKAADFGCLPEVG